MELVIVIAGVVLGVFLLSALTGAPYVPTLRKDSQRVFREVLRSDDVLVDIGSGDGAAMVAALEAGVQRAVGYEINPMLCAVSRLRLWRLWRRLRPEQRSSVYWRNAWQVTFPPDTTVFYAFTVARDAQRLHSLVQQFATQHRRTVRLISYGFAMPGQEGKLVGPMWIYEVTPQAQ